MRRWKSSVVVSLWVVLLPSIVLAQRERGTIVGRVTDPSGAVIPNVTITVTNENTGVVSTSGTTGEGIYTVPALPTGIYRVEAKKDGFKTGQAEHIEIGVAQEVTIDLTLEVGAVTEKVTVTAEAPLLDLTSPEVGNSMNDKLFHELPIAISDVRQAQQFIFQSSPGTTGDTFSGSINGGQLFSHEILIDGISIARYDISGGSLDEFTPSVDAIGEFKLQANNYSAEYGESQGGIVSFTMKSGTNDFHGSIYEFHRNRVLDAAGYNVNTFAPNGLDSGGNAVKAQRVVNDFGGTVGGPIWIPKIYNGRNKSFFYFAYDGLRKVERPRGRLMSMPTAAQLDGDFSALLGGQLANCGPDADQPCSDALGRPIMQGAIYDPASTRTVAAGAVDDDPNYGTGLTNNSGSGAVIRNPFDGNIIPQDQWSAVSSNILPFYQQIPLVNQNVFRNVARSGTGQPWLNVNTWSLKVDHTLNDRHRLSGSFNYNKRPRANGVVFFGGGPLNLEQVQSITGRQGRVAWDWTVSDHMLNHFAVGYNRFTNPNYSKVADEDWAGQIGLTGVTDAHFPQSTFGTSCFNPSDLRLGCIGSSTNSLNVSESYIIVDDFSYTRGKHQFKWGFEGRRYRQNQRNKGGTSGTFAWSNTQTALPGFQGSFGGGLFDTGWPFASFLLGTADRASRPVIEAQTGDRQSLYVLYFQDDWRATSKLTVSYGLRWDIPTPRTEAFNRISGFDPSAPNPGADGIAGALVFLSDQGKTSFQEHYWRELGPRIGLAYQLNSKTVLRAGYGITYTPPISNSWGGWNTQGFNSSIVVSHGTPDPRFAPGPDPWDPVLNWDNGMPPFTGVLPDTNPASQNFDQSGAFIDWLKSDSLRQPYVQQWSVGFQRQLPGDSVVEVNYVGNKGTRLIASLFSAAVNAAPTRFMSLVDADGNALVNKTFGDLTASDWAVLNANGVTGKPYASFPDDVPISQALKPYPQYAGINDVYPNFAASTYNSLQVSWRKRPTKGLAFIAAYTFSKTLTDSESGHTYHHYGSPYSGYYNVTQWPENRKIEKAVADFDVPHSIKLTWVYELPFGRGKAFANRGGVVDKLIGGWKVTGIHNYAPVGAPFIPSSYIPAAISTGPYGGGHWATRPDMNGDWSGVSGNVQGSLNPDGTPYLNVPGFDSGTGCNGPFCLVPTSADGYALHPGNAPRVFSNIRLPGQFSEQFGIIKSIPFAENRYVEIMANFFNAFNRHGFGYVDPIVDSPTFGMVLSPSQGPRSIQFAARVVF
ncbi:MAG: carboxypeptidase regulatory-like domain-containing protein [Terriglobia bacterium]